MHPICLVTRDALTAPCDVILLPLLQRQDGECPARPDAWWSPLGWGIQARLVEAGRFELVNSPVNRALLMDLFWHACKEGVADGEFPDYLATWAPEVCRHLNQTPEVQPDPALSWPELRSCWNYLFLTGAQLQGAPGRQYGLSVMRASAWQQLIKLCDGLVPGETAEKISADHFRAVTSAITADTKQERQHQANNLFWALLARLAPWARLPRPGEQLRLLGAYMGGRMSQEVLDKHLLPWRHTWIALAGMELLNLQLTPMVVKPASDPWGVSQMHQMLLDRVHDAGTTRYP